MHEIAADNSSFVEFVADSLMPPEQETFVVSHRPRRPFTTAELMKQRKIRNHDGTENTGKNFKEA